MVYSVYSCVWSTIVDWYVLVLQLLLTTPPVMPPALPTVWLHWLKWSTTSLALWRVSWPPYTPTLPHRRPSMDQVERWVELCLLKELFQKKIPIFWHILLTVMYVRMFSDVFPFVVLEMAWWSWCLSEHHPSHHWSSQGRGQGHPSTRRVSPCLSQDSVSLVILCIL